MTENTKQRAEGWGPIAQVVQAVILAVVSVLLTIQFYEQVALGKENAAARAVQVTHGQRLDKIETAILNSQLLAGDVKAISAQLDALAKAQIRTEDAVAKALARIEKQLEEHMKLK